MTNEKSNEGQRKQANALVSGLSIATAILLISFTSTSLTVPSLNPVCPIALSSSETVAARLSMPVVSVTILIPIVTVVSCTTLIRVACKQSFKFETTETSLHYICHDVYILGVKTYLSFLL